MARPSRFISARSARRQRGENISKSNRMSVSRSPKKITPVIIRLARTRRTRSSRARRQCVNCCGRDDYGIEWDRLGHGQDQLRSATSMPPNDSPSRPSPVNSLLSLLITANARTNSPPAVVRSTQVFCHPSGPCSIPRPLRSAHLHVEAASRRMHLDATLIIVHMCLCGDHFDVEWSSVIGWDHSWDLDHLLSNSIDSSNCKEPLKASRRSWNSAHRTSGARRKTS